MKTRAELPTGRMLAHFTRASSRASAMDNLLAILSARVIRASSRMVHGKTKVVCLFDAPLAELGAVLTPRNRRRYEPFGIAVDKRYAFAQGARPVIYMPLAEASAILKMEEMWRVVNIDIRRDPPVDWTHEREWRVRGDLALRPERCVVLVESWRDVEEIYDNFAGTPPCAGILPLREIFNRPGKSLAAKVKA